jgi:hypothetical protein
MPLPPSQDVYMKVGPQAGRDAKLQCEEHDAFMQQQEDDRQDREDEAVEQQREREEDARRAQLHEGEEYNVQSGVSSR